MLINPPGRLFQRGEDRSQGNIEDSAATSLRAPNDLAYMASVLRKSGIVSVIRDYPAEQLDWTDFEDDIRSFMPDILIMSITNATVYGDLRAFQYAKEKNPEIITIAKGALFLSIPVEQLTQSVFDKMDFALTGEAETIICGLMKAISSGDDLSRVQGILYRDTDNLLRRSPPAAFVTDLDTIPFPARDLLKNELYVRPDTGEAQATIQTSRGCPGSCIFCLTPVISGKKIRVRSAKNIADEICECIERYGIRNFFFKADTFTMNKPHVIEVCREIIDRKLDIQWVANSRVDTLDDERLEWMKKAGCWLVAVGFESGNDESLKKMKKNTDVKQAHDAACMVRRHGLQLYGFFIIGLPWENQAAVRDTISFAKKLKCDYAEIHIAVPYEGTELHSVARENNLFSGAIQGHDYFRDPVMNTLYMDREEIIRFRQKGLTNFYFSPSYVWSRLQKVNSPRKFMNHVRYGFRLIRQLL